MADAFGQDSYILFEAYRGDCRPEQTSQKRGRMRISRLEPKVSVFLVGVLWSGILVSHSQAIGSSPDAAARIDTIGTERLSSIDSVLIDGAQPRVVLADNWRSSPVMGTAELLIRRAATPTAYEAHISAEGRSLLIGPLMIEQVPELTTPSGNESGITLGSGFETERWSRDNKWMCIPFRIYEGLDISLERLYLIDLVQLRLVDSIGPLGLGVLDFSPDGKFLVFSDFADLWVIDLTTMNRVCIAEWGGYAQTGGENHDQSFTNLRWVGLTHTFEVEFHSDPLLAYSLRVQLP